MARVVRKVSNKAVQNQKKNNILHNKIFWIIISVVLVIGVAVGIVLGIVLNQDKEERSVKYYLNKVSGFSVDFIFLAYIMYVRSIAIVSA